MITEFNVDSLNVRVYKSRDDMGAAAAKEVVARINQLHDRQQYVHIVFAAAPSQNEFLAALKKERVDWSRVVAFHMDEYVKLPADAPQGFGNFLRTRLFGVLPFHSVHYLDGNAADLQAECRRYSHLLQLCKPDMVCMGIGENTHIAFNDPHVADFDDPEWVKVVDLDEQCRQQQVNDGCFSSLEEVPAYALTLTVPALTEAEYIYCMVPGENKARAVSYTLYEEINEKYPSTVLRKHRNAMLFLDNNSSKQLKELA